jgi:hypothetical protein
MRKKAPRVQREVPFCAISAPRSGAEMAQSNYGKFDLEGLILWGLPRLCEPTSTMQQWRGMGACFYRGIFTSVSHKQKYVLGLETN